VTQPAAARGQAAVIGGLSVLDRLLPVWILAAMAPAAAPGTRTSCCPADYGVYVG
jgi:hypothetical protein